jgi:nitrogen regulatory protein PII
MVATKKMKLVTIIISSELLDRLVAGLKAFGVPGYTSVAVDGHGLHGSRTRNAFDSGNVRLETVVTPALAQTLLEYLAMEYASFDILTFTQDVDVLPRPHLG